MIEFITFGTKYGRVHKSDRQIDATWLPNPPRDFWVSAALAEQWLIDQLLFRTDVCEQFQRLANEVIRGCIAASDDADRDHKIAFACIGGKHRSVFLADRIAFRLRTVHGIQVDVHHLDAR